MQKSVLIILLIIFNLTFGQDFLIEFDRYNPIYTFKWDGYEVPNHYEVKLEFIKYIDSNKLLEEEKRALEMMDTQLRFEIRAVDLNNDKLADIIYQGPYTGEGSVVYIFIQTESGFQKVFTTQQGIMKVDWKGEHLDKLYVKDWGCCADPNLTNSVYQASYSGSIPSFKLIWKSVELRSFITKPKHTFTPKRFEIVNQKYKFRANPWIDDKTVNEFLGITGNTIGILKKGYKGTAYASHEDDTGRIWWYVLIDREHELENTYINYKHHRFKPHLIGWISSRFIKEIKN
ncbi:hypothetical protein [Aquimarina macrocephali]|uniref:hypothetical protein n=1 Tax=Aquimarina macrocephali TaxID=666563 RepID=UPI00046641D5|nr:hypothetical protein [Aquimarina macrocephali]